MTLGDYISNYRKTHELSMADFAKLSGISKAYVSILEKNKQPATGKPVEPTVQTIRMVAEATGVDFNWLFSQLNQWVNISQDFERSESVRINVYGQVAAGLPMEMIEDIYDTEEIPVDWVRGDKEYFGLVIKGDSMLPRMRDGDVIIVRKQEDAETGETVVATVNGNDATCKVLRKSPTGIELLPTNPAHAPQFYSNEDVLSLPVKILGKVVELRAKY